MGNSNNNHSRGFLSNALGVAKKLSNVGLELVNQSKVNKIYKENTTIDSFKIIEGVARQKKVFDMRQSEQPQQILRNYVPLVTQQLLGRHYNVVNKAANAFAPQLSDKVSDYFFDRLNTFTNNISSVDSVLDQAGIKDLEELTQDINRSKRLSQALVEQNKWIASVQGVITGATGVIGSSVDIPMSIILVLKTIYQVGRSYGFELNKKDEQDVVQYIFQQINLGILAEKQTLLMGLRAISRTLQTHDVKQLQQLLGSSNDIELLKQWFVNDLGAMKWEWLSHIPKVSALSKLSPVIGATISASYSWKLVEDVNEKAQDIFSNARCYLNDHKDTSLSIMAAYENSLHQVTQMARDQSNATKISSDILTPESVLIAVPTEVKKNQEIEKLDQLHETSQTDLPINSSLEQAQVISLQAVTKRKSPVKLASKEEASQFIEQVEPVQKKPVKRVIKKSKLNNTNE